MEYIIPDNLLKIVGESDIIVFEGFEMTGKSTLAQKVRENCNHSYLYRPDWEGVLTPSVISRGNRYIPGLAIVDSWRSMHEQDIVSPDTKLFLDRWMPSSFVYYIMYSQKADFIEESLLSDSFLAAARGMKIIIFHKKHSSKEEARAMYEITESSSSDHEDSYDKFKNFDEYYKAYLAFEKCYEEFYSSNLNPFQVIRLSSLTNEILEKG